MAPKHLNLLLVQLKEITLKSLTQMSEASESGCTFVCPQLQSFNASLPTASATSMGAAGLDGSMQATSVVEHKVRTSFSCSLFN